MEYFKLECLHIGQEIKVPFNVKYLYHQFDGNEIHIHVLERGGQEICVIAENSPMVRDCPWFPGKKLVGRGVLTVKRIDYGKV